MGSEIDELKQKIQQLEEENRILNKIIQKAPIPIFVLDKAHRISHFNQALEELAGLRAKDVIGTRDQWRAFYAAPRPVMADLIIDQSSDKEITEHYEGKYSRPPRTADRFAATDFFPDLPPEGKWLFFTASPFTDSQGNIAGAVETLQDVTQEKIKENKIRALYRIYRNILEFIPYPIIVYGDRGIVSYVNPAFSKVFGWTLEEVKGKPLNFVPGTLEQETRDMLNQFGQNKQLARYETQRLTRDGAVLDVVMWAATHVQEGILENFVILRDITEEKRLAANNQSIMRISAALPEYPDLEDLMDYISREVKELLVVEGAVVLLYDEIKEDLFFLGAAYDDQSTQERAKEIRFTLDEVLAGKVMKTGNPAVNNAADASLKDYPERDRKMGYQTRSILCVPIKSDSRIIGVLCAINKKQNLFDDNDMELMAMIAGTVGISIENARFSEALKEAYRDVASMNRAKGKAINHLSHELKTPVAILSGSLQILRKKIEALPNVKLTSTLNRIERNLDRIVDIQTETSDIMETGEYEARQLLIKMLEACQDELETLIETCLDQDILDPDHLIQSVRALIDREFGPRSLHHKTIDFKKTFNTVYSSLIPKFHFRRVQINTDIRDGLPDLHLPPDVVVKIIEGLIRNAIENTPDQGRIDISARPRENGILFEVRDFGVGIEPDHQKRIFEGFFSTQATLLYSTKTPFEFSAGGKGADLLRMKLFADRLGFSIEMTSQRCGFLVDNQDPCPGNILNCRFCNDQDDCLNSGNAVFSVFFPNGKK
ncbi:MAG: PAS domain S-box protein [Desulfobacterales bacterium]|nr:PAS domain S-box protein [Desulfobacterales bacterium]